MQSWLQAHLVLPQPPVTSSATPQPPIAPLPLIQTVTSAPLTPTTRPQPVVQPDAAPQDPNSQSASNKPDTADSSQSEHPNQYGNEMYEDNDGGFENDTPLSQVPPSTRKTLAQTLLSSIRSNHK